MYARPPLEQTDLALPRTTAHSLLPGTSPVSAQPTRQPAHTKRTAAQQAFLYLTHSTRLVHSAKLLVPATSFPSCACALFAKTPGCTPTLPNSERPGRIPRHHDAS